MREPTHYTMAKNVAGETRKKCKACAGLTRPNLKVCRHCGKRFIKRPKAKKLARGSRERLKAEVAHAEQMAERWAATSKRSLDTWHKWNRKARKLAARLQQALTQPQATKEPRRGIVLKELT